MASQASDTTLGNSDNNKCGEIDNLSKKVSEKIRTEDSDVEGQGGPSTTSNPWGDPSLFPDGGLEAWLVVLGCFCSLFVSFGWIGCIGVFQEYYQLNPLKNYSPSTVAWIPALEACFMFLGGSWVGRIQDLYGPRYLLLVGTCLHVFGLMMASISKKYYQFLLAQAVCSSIGASMVFYPAFACLATWFFKKRAAAFGIAAVGSSLGAVLFPIIILKLIPEIGFPWTMRTCAFIILGMLIIANLTVKSRLPPVKTPVRLMDFVNPLAEMPFLLLTISQFLYFLGLFIPFTFLSVQAIHKGMGPTLAIYLISILNAASIIGRTLPAGLADKYGRFNVLIIQAWLAAIFVLALWIPANSNLALILFAVFFGFASGTIVSMTPALVAQISDVRQIGVRTGTLYTFVAIAVLVGNPIGGALVSQDNGSYVHLQIYAGCTMIAGTLFLMASRISLVGWKLAVKV